MTEWGWKALQVAQTIGALLNAIALLAFAIIIGKLLPVIRQRAPDITELSLGLPFRSIFTIKLNRSVETLAAATQQKMHVLGDAYNSTVTQLHKLLTPEAVIGLNGLRVLWVDDIPANNRLEERALRDLGLVIYKSLDTAHALERLSLEVYDLVISDMARPSGGLAGYDLLRAMRSRGDETPLLFYSSSGSEEHRAQALREGAQGSTNDPRVLIKDVLRVLQAKPL